MKLNISRPLKFLLVLFFSAISIKTSAINHCLFQPVDTNEINVQLNLCNKLVETDTLKARLCLENVLALSKSMNYFKGITFSSYSLGKYFYNQFDLLKAENYFTESIEASRKWGNKTLEAGNNNNLGNIAKIKGDYSSAVSYYLSAIELFDFLNDKKGKSVSESNISGAYYLLEEKDKAIDYLKKSLNLKLQLNDSISLVYDYQLLGNIYCDLIEYDSSKYYYQKCIDISKFINDLKSMGIAYNSIGEITMIEENYKQASLFFSKALYYSRSVNDVKNISDIYDNLGLLNFYSDRLPEAFAFLDSSLAISQLYDLKEEKKNAYKHLADFNESQKNYKDAFINLQNYSTLQNDWLTEKGNVAGMEALFDKLKQEKEILKYEKEKEKHKTQIVILVATIFIIMIMALLGFYIYRIRQKAKNANKLAELEKERFKAVIEAQEMERKRIAGDLHDSVGQMLSLSKLHLSEIIDSIQVFDTENEQMLSRSVQIIDEACQEVRNISHNLMPGPLIRLGLTSAVKDLVRKINSSKKIQIMFSSNLNDNRLDEKVEISVYRIIQEIFSNILKHAQASKIEVNLNKGNDNKLKLSIIDDGIGFDKEEIINSKGIGWKNIYSRLAIINGSMDVNAVKNHGTDIEINVLL
jgi:two-component system, NarL family, sensor kinase